MRIYTLNVNGFRGFEKDITDDITHNEIMENLHNFHSLVQELITDRDSVIIVQEVPHKRFDKSVQPWKWYELDIYREFINMFAPEFNIILPKHLINSLQCTVALCRKDSFWECIDKEHIIYDSKYSFGNKLVELQYKKTLTLLGVHINPTDEMWDMLFQSFKINDTHTFVVGDFNAYEYRGSMYEKPQQLRRFNLTSFIPSNVITDYKHKSSIDNIYVKNNLRIENSIHIDVRRTEEFKTDHALCYIELR